MEVFLVPLGNLRYELYCEPSEEEAVEALRPESSTGAFKGLGQKFQETLKEAERNRHHPPAGVDGSAPARRGWTRRLRDRTLRWVAEKVAEQRLLWHLRTQASVTLVYPNDLGEADVAIVLRQMLRRDADRHRLWLTVDSVGLGLSGLLIPVPGPNVIAYYFAFRVVGHFLSVRGARQGLDRIVWQFHSSAPLTELRQAASVTGAAREQLVTEIAGRLHLQHLANFFTRIALPSA